VVPRRGDPPGHGGRRVIAGRRFRWRIVPTGVPDLRGGWRSTCPCYGKRLRHWIRVSGTAVRSAFLSIAVTCAAIACQAPDPGSSRDGFVLVSPFEAASNAYWENLIAEEVAVVSNSLNAPLPKPPVQVHLVSVEVADDAPIRELLDPEIEGVRAWHEAGQAIYLVVPASGDGLYAPAVVANLRHELTHVLVRRMGLRPAPWFDEGFAHEIGSALRIDRGLALDPVPIQPLLARVYRDRVDLDNVWSWDGGRSQWTIEAGETEIRCLSQSIVRFLLERAGTDWHVHLPQLVKLKPGDDPALIQEWIDWLDGFDVGARFANALSDPNTEIRRAAAESLPSLAEVAQELDGTVSGLRSCINGETDRLALEALGDDAMFDGAARYLVFFRAADLDDADIAALECPERERSVRLVGLALRARRGSEPPVDQVRELWGCLSAQERDRISWLRAVMPVIAHGP
jgi:hypothetical protein